MKYLSLLSLVAFLMFTWMTFHKPKDIPEEVHIDLQENLIQLISDYIETRLPTTKNIEFQRIWTERIKATKVKASFVYSFEEENPSADSSKTHIDGYAILNKNENSTSSETWTFDELYILNSQIRFGDSIVIRPNQTDQ